jgi:hypothetical protein
MFGRWLPIADPLPCAEKVNPQQPLSGDAGRGCCAVVS